MSEGSVSQSGNTSGGAIVGGDYAEGDLTKHYHAPAARETALGRLFRRLATEVCDDPGLTRYIAALEIYTRKVEDETVIGLEQKFQKSGRLDQLEMAMRYKESMYADLRRNMFSKTFQTIYATLMAKVFEEFETWVKPEIIAGQPRPVIDRLVNSHIIRPIVDELEGCENFDGVAIATVRGMVYFLTGNCHLVWH